MVAVGPDVDGLERRPAHLAEESENCIYFPFGGPALAPAGRIVGNVGFPPDACHSLGARDECNVVIVRGDNDPLDLVL